MIDRHGCPKSGVQAIDQGKHPIEQTLCVDDAGRICSATITSAINDNYISPSQRARRPVVSGSTPALEGLSRVRTTDAQVRKLMEEMTAWEPGLGGAAGGHDRKTARKYVRAGQLPSEMTGPRTWRTREDPFEEHWPEVRRGSRTRRRSRRRRCSSWSAQVRTATGRAAADAAAPGEAVAGGGGPRRRSCSRSSTGRARRCRRTSRGRASAVTIAGQVFLHLLCVLVLPYSNWQWATVCLSESMAALRRGVQARCSSSGACRVPPDGQLDGGDARSADGQAGLQRGVPGA